MVIKNYFRAKNAPTKPNLVTTKQPEGNNDFILETWRKLLAAPLERGAKHRTVVEVHVQRTPPSLASSPAKCLGSPSQPVLPRRTGFSPTGVAVLSWVAPAATTLSPAKARRV